MKTLKTKENDHEAFKALRNGDTYHCANRLSSHPNSIQACSTSNAITQLTTTQIKPSQGKDDFMGGGYKWARAGHNIKRGRLKHEG